MFGELLRSFRQTAGLSQEELAERAEMSVSGISAIERGERKRPYPHTIRRLADALGLDPDERSRLIAGSRDASGSPVATPERDGNLPASLTTLIGRAEELARIGDLLREHRLVTLVGMGGVGKSRLALAAADEVASDPRLQVWIVDLEGLADPTLVPTAIASSCEVQGADVMDSLIAWISNRSVLLVLDGCERAVKQVAEHSETLLSRCPALRILATSQEPLKIQGEMVLALRPFDLERRDELEAATSLFVDRVRRHSGAADWASHKQAIADICRRVEGIPLGIELAAGWAHVMTPEAIQQKLDDPLRLLNLPSAETTAGRHRALRAALEHTHGLLEPDEQTLFRRLGVFEGGCTLDAIESVCQRGLEDPLVALGRLVDLSLVVVDADGRYRMLDTVLRFAREVASGGEDDDLGAAHASYFLRVAQAAAPRLRTADAAEWWARIEDDIDNLRAALRYLDETGDEKGLLRLTAALSMYWERRSHIDEGLRWIERATAPDHEPSAELAQTLNAFALLRWKKGGERNLRGNSDRLLAVAEAIGDVGIQAMAVHMLAMVPENPDPPADMERAIALARRSGDPWTLALVLNDSTYFGPQGMETPSDIPRLEEALAHARSSGDPHLVALVLDSLAVAHLAAGDAGEALRHWSEMIDTTDLLRDPWLGLAVVDGLAELALLQGDPERCLQLMSLSTRHRELTSIQDDFWYQEQRAGVLEAARSSLTAEAADAAWESGADLNLEDLVGNRSGVG